MSTLTSVSGFPRIGQNRELKKIIEGYWKGANDLAAVKATAAELRAKHWKLQQAAGIDLIPSNDFSYYDQMLDTAILLNVIPQRYARLSFDNQEDTLFAMARGYQGDKGDVTALPMKKWFTTIWCPKSSRPRRSSSTPPSRSTSSTRPRLWASTPSPCSSARTRS